jgi:hypothetical protein
MRGRLSIEEESKQLAVDSNQLRTFVPLEE